MDNTLFPTSPDDAPPGQAPLAERMRPRKLDQVVGQEHLLGPGKILSEVVRADEIPSMKDHAGPNNCPGDPRSFRRSECGAGRR